MNRCKVFLAGLVLPACASVEVVDQQASASLHGQKQVFLTKLHCYDVNDGGINGHSDEVYWKKIMKGNVHQRVEVGDFKNGTSREFRRVSLYSGSQNPIVLMEDDPNGFDDVLGSFRVDPKTMAIHPTGNTQVIATPPGAPPGSVWLRTTGSGARYEVRLLVAETPPAD
jgi:hypothetical protein